MVYHAWRFSGNRWRQRLCKSTFLSLLAGVLEPDQGVIHASSKVTPLLGFGSSINEYQTGYENIVAELQTHLGRPPSDEEVSTSAAFTELSDAVLNESLHTYSERYESKGCICALVCNSTRHPRDG